jgi:hypothetical protein
MTSIEIKICMTPDLHDISIDSDSAYIEIVRIEL